MFAKKFSRAKRWQIVGARFIAPRGWGRLSPLQSTCASGKRISCRSSFDKTPQKRLNVWQGNSSEEFCDRTIHHVLHFTNTLGSLLTFFRQRQCHHYSICNRGYSFDKPCFNHPINQSTRTASLTNQQITQSKKRQWLKLL